jgi:hypothetical protein
MSTDEGGGGGGGLSADAAQRGELSISDMALMLGLERPAMPAVNLEADVRWGHCSPRALCAVRGAV